MFIFMWKIFDNDLYQTTYLYLLLLGFFDLKPSSKRTIRSSSRLPYSPNCESYMVVLDPRETPSKANQCFMNTLAFVITDKNIVVHLLKCLIINKWITLTISVPNS